MYKNYSRFKKLKTKIMKKRKAKKSKEKEKGREKKQNYTELAPCFSLVFQFVL